MKQIENVRVTVAIKVERVTGYETKAISNVEKITNGTRDLKNILQDVKAMAVDVKNESIDALCKLIEAEETEEAKKENA